MTEYTRFINPYHFVPLGQKEVERRDAGNILETPELLTGKIEVLLKTRTPLFIPDVHGQPRDGENQHREYQFFSYDDNGAPVIPGSSLRGMLRSNYETLTNSCLSVVNTKEKPKRRTSDYYQPGLLKRVNGVLTLHKAKRAVCFGGNTDRLAGYYQGGEKPSADGLQEGIPVYMRLQKDCEVRINNAHYGVDKVVQLSNERHTENGWETGYSYLGEPGVRKTGNDAYFFYFDRGAAGNPIGSRKLQPDGPEITELKNVLDSYAEEAARTGGNHHGYRKYRQALEHFLAYGNGYFPVWYSQPSGENGNLLYLSCACVTKEIYNHTISDILRAQGKHQACTKRTALCPACRLFGMVGEDADNAGYYPNAWGSSVRVQDAVLCGEAKDRPRRELFGKKIILRELASPRPSSTEFYLQKPRVNRQEVLSWSYDYYVSRRHPDDRYPKVTAYTPKIAGRKYYWHHTDAAQPEVFVEKTERNCTVTLLKENVTFSFPVYFEKITEEQLQQLIWLLNISSIDIQENGRAKYGYKLGKGKPLGLGSVELTVKGVQVRRLKEDGKLRYRLEDYEYSHLTYEDAGFDTDIKNAFLRICDFNAVGDTPVSYPVSDGQSVKSVSEGFKWFGYNRFNVNGGNKRITTRVNQEFQQYMGVLEENSEIALAVNKEVDRTRAEACLEMDNDNAKANDLLPAAGAKVSGCVIQQNGDTLTVKLNRADREAPEIRVQVGNVRGNFRTGARVTVQITSVRVYNGNPSYRGRLARKTQN